MKKSVLIARLLLGAIFLIFGLNGFFLFIPVPPMEGPAAEFMGALLGTGYMLPFWKSVEVIAGILLLSNRFVPFALAMLAPIVANILTFHVFLAPSGLIVGALVTALEAFLIFTYRANFNALLQKKAEPAQ